MNSTPDSEYEMKNEYTLDYSKGVRGKYYEAAMRNKGFVKLDEDLLKAFPSTGELNAALRGLLEASKHIHLNQSV
jgi:uncharacterized protein (DUF4415 family)